MVFQVNKPFQFLFGLVNQDVDNTYHPTVEQSERQIQGIDMGYQWG